MSHQAFISLAIAKSSTATVFSHDWIKAKPIFPSGKIWPPTKLAYLLDGDTSNANTVISQTTDLTLVAGSDFELDEFVYQGSSSNTSTFSGYVNDQTTNVVKLTNVKGSLSVGAPLYGLTTNPTGRIVVSETNPELQPYTGDIIYAQNVTKTQRTDGQAENLKFVISF